MKNILIKVGDRVRIKSIDWYNENKNKFGEINYKRCAFTNSMTQYCDSILTIVDKTKDYYWVDENMFIWTDEMIEGLVEEEITNVMDEDKKLIGWIKEPNRYRLVPDKDYEIKYDEKGFFYLEKKKKEYPKTYEECCEVLVGRKPNPNEISFDKMELCLVDLDNTQSIDFQNPLLFQLNSLFRLLMCRAAYWKIAGDEMGLGKPWEPEWNIYEHKFCLGTDKDKVIEECVTTGNRILAFPTEEIRDAFYEAFKEEIEICKELL